MKKRRASSRSGDAAAAAVDPRVRELYAAPPDAFVAARDALARELASEGSGRAAAVRRLRRPTVAVWLLDAVARERPELVEALLEAGDRLRQAQARAVRGGGAELRAASAGVSEAVGAALEAARQLAGGAGREVGAAVLGQLEQGLRAAATADVASREPLRHGVLDRLPEPGGVELLTGLGLVPAVAEPAAGGAPSERSAAAPRGRARGAAGRARAAAEAREAARRDRERRRAASEAERLERAHHVAEGKAQQAERALAEAQRRASAARQRAEAALQAARAARARAGARDGR